MFGMMEAMLSFLRRQVGLRTDSASASGSLHAKFADGLNRIGSANPASGGTDTLFKYLKKLSSEQGNFNISTPKFVRASSDSQSLTTVLNVSGSGFLVSCYCMAPSSSTTNRTYHYLQITIDGDEIVPEYNFAISGLNPDINVVVALPFLFRFNNSLLIKHRKGQYGSTIYTTAMYILD